MLQWLGELSSPMVAEEVPLVAWLVRRDCCPRVGVKRSRERTNRRVAATVQVRPALGADPAQPVCGPIMDLEERGANSTTTTTWCASRLTARPPFLMRASIVDAEEPV